MALRRKWFTDVPVGVTRAEYRSYTGARVFTFVAYGFAALLVLTLLGGVFGARQAAMDAAPAVGLDDVVNGRHPAGAAVRLTGRLSGAPVIVPGASERTVLAGKLEVSLSARSTRLRRGENRGSRPPSSLNVYRWKEKTETLFLTDGVHSIELAAPFAALPLKKERSKSLPIDDDDDPRPLAVHYDELRIEVPAAKLERLPSQKFRARAELAVLELDTQVTVVAGPIPRGDSFVLGEPEDAKLLVLRGAPQDIARGGWLMTIYVIALLIAALAVGNWQRLRARRMYREFEARQASQV